MLRLAGNHSRLSSECEYEIGNILDWRPKDTRSTLGSVEEGTGSDNVSRGCLEEPKPEQFNRV